jgi:hypothetical protein
LESSTLPSTTKPIAALTNRENPLRRQAKTQRAPVSTKRRQRVAQIHEPIPVKRPEPVKTSPKAVTKTGRHRTEPVPDDIFFTIHQIQLGTKLLCLGRLDPHSIWEVVAITNGPTLRRARGRLISQDTVQHLTDICHLRRLRGAGEDYPRQGNFGYLSYSAIWRLYHGD